MNDKVLSISFSIMIACFIVAGLLAVASLSYGLLILFLAFHPIPFIVLVVTLFTSLFVYKTVKNT